MSEKSEKYKQNNASQVKESYKTIRTNLIYALAGADKKVVAVSSATPADGKSTTSANLAITIAQTGNSVLLVDSDLRRPTLHKMFRVANHNGLSKILSKQNTIEEALIPDVKPNLSLITSGPIPPNPSELLSTSLFANTVNKLAEEFDYLILDTPPVNIVSDCQIIVRVISGVVLVARYRVSQYKEIETAAESIKNVGGTILGIVINDVNEKSHSYYKGKYYKNYYSYVDPEI